MGRFESKIEIEEFIDYDCFLLSANKALVQENFNSRTTWFKYYVDQYRYNGLNATFSMMPDFTAMTIDVSHCFNVFDNDRLLVHPGCTIPRKLISKGTVINDKSIEAPNKFVIPDRYKDYLYAACGNRYPVIFMVNEAIKTVFAVVPGTLKQPNIGGSFEQWKETLKRSSQLAAEYGHYLDEFEMPFGNKLHLIVGNALDIDKFLLNGGIPKHLVISENDVPTGSEEPNADLLAAAYNMLKSPDNQIVETALNMLAQSRFMRVRRLVGWILAPYCRKVRSYKNRSTSVAWLYLHCIEKLSPSLMFPSDEEKKLAQEFVTKITNNEVLWTETGSPVYGVGANLSDASLRELISKARTD